MKTIKLTKREKSLVLKIKINHFCQTINPTCHKQLINDWIPLKISFAVKKKVLRYLRTSSSAKSSLFPRSKKTIPSLLPWLLEGLIASWALKIQCFAFKKEVSLVISYTTITASAFRKYCRVIDLENMRVFIWCNKYWLTHARGDIKSHNDMIRNFDTYNVLVQLYPNIEDRQKSGQLPNYDFENPRQLLRWKLQVR